MIVPNVIKIGFIAGVRRGHGVVLVRDAEGEWSLPQFVTLTGGSVGWQAGIQGTDVVLVFTTAKGVQGLMQGKFTIGADASVVGRAGRSQRGRRNRCHAEVRNPLLFAQPRLVPGRGDRRLGAGNRRAGPRRLLRLADFRAAPPGSRFGHQAAAILGRQLRGRRRWRHAAVAGRTGAAAAGDGLRTGGGPPAARSAGFAGQPAGGRAAGARSQARSSCKRS